MNQDIEKDKSEVERHNSSASTAFAYNGITESSSDLSIQTPSNSKNHENINYSNNNTNGNF